MLAAHARRSRSSLAARRGFIPLETARPEGPSDRARARAWSLTGFTLVEMLVVVGITSMLAGAILSYTATSRDRVALSVEEAKLAQTISRAKSLALTTYARDEIPCGYGVSLNYDANAYELFAYTPPLKEDGTEGRCGVILTLDDANKSERELFAFSPNVVFGEGEERLEHVLFVPPRPSTWIWRLGDTTTSTSGRIYLTNRNDTAPVAIEVGAGGQVSF